MNGEHQKKTGGQIKGGALRWRTKREKGYRVEDVTGERVKEVSL